MDEALRRKLDLVPGDPGVYLWKDETGRIIYVGKAKVLRHRVRSYFQNLDEKDPKTLRLIGRVRDVDWIVTHTEKEALILEATLIKRHTPRYNIRLRDDKRFLCLKLDTAHPFPRLYLVRRIQRDGAVYYGPFDNARAARETLRFANVNFPVRKCSDQQFAGRTRPCIQHQIHRCRAPCVGLIDREAYAAIVQQVRAFFAGQLPDIIPELRAEMERLSAALQFEEAAAIRDRIEAIEQTLSRQQAARPTLVDSDVFGFYREGAAVVIVCLFVRAGAIIGQRVFPFKGQEDDSPVVLAQLLGQYYSQDNYLPREVLLPFEPEGGIELFADWLSEQARVKVALRVPQRGEGRELADMANLNAHRQFEVRQSQLVSADDVLDELRAKLHLPRTPETIECFDISNISGTLAVASLVRFAQGEPDKAGYRRFRIRLPNEPNDYAMMREVLSRRLARGVAEGNLPDLLLVDGGKGQLNIAVEVLAEFHQTAQPVAAITKIKDLEPGETGAHDKVYLPGRKNAVTFRANNNALLLLQRVRDESHRFAIEYHRLLRSKKITASELDEVPGLGGVKKKALLRVFGSVKRVREATLDELAAVPGIGPKLAEAIHQHLLTR